MTHEFNNISSDFVHGTSLSLGLFNLIEEKVKVGNNVKIRNYVELRRGVIIGDNCYIDSRVSMSGGTNYIMIGKNVSIEKGAIIGAQPTAFYGEELREPQAGVTISDYAWIGSNSVVMLGLERDTFIGKNVKIGALCNIGHDVIIEDGTLIINGTKILGFAQIGKKTIINLGVRIRERVKIGNGSIIGMGSNVVSDIPDNVVAYGNPCRIISKREHPLKHYARMYLR